MPLDFPNSPSTNDTYTFGGVTWKYDGAKWRLLLAEVGNFGAFTSYTPVLTASTTNPTLGSGSTQSGWYIQVGKLVIANFVIQFGTSGTNAGSGTYRVSVPVTGSNNMKGGTPATNITFGTGRVSRSSNFLCSFRFNPSNDNVEVVYESSAGTLVAVTNSAPGAWTANDYIQGQLIYEAA